MLINVLDYASPEAAIAAAADGDRVYFPGVRNYVAPAGAYQITKSLEVFGDGPGDPATQDTGTLIRPYAGAPQDTCNVFEIAPPPGAEISAVHLHRFKINANGPVRPGAGVYCKLVPANNHRVRSIRLERIDAFGLGGNLIHLEGGDLTTTFIEALSMTECATSGALGFGVMLKNVWLGKLVMCTLLGNAAGGCYFEASGASMYCGDMDDNAISKTSTQGAMRFKSCKMAVVDATHVENFNTITAATPAFPNPPYRLVPVGILVEGSGGAALVTASSFHQGATTSDSTGIRVTGSPAGPIAILPNYHKRVFGKLIDSAAVYSSTIGPQFYASEEFSDATAIILNTQPNGITTYPGIPVLPGTAFPAFAPVPLTVPVSLITPAGVVAPGMMYFSSDATAMMVRVGTAWKTIQTI